MATPPPRVGLFVARMTAVAALVGAEVIHSAYLDVHYREWVAAGVFFLVLSVAEGILAMALLLFPGPRASRAAVAASIATVAVWLVSRTSGLPIGPEAFRAERIGRGDSIATALEVLTVLALLPLAREGAGAGRLPADRRRAGIVAVAVVSVIVGVATGVAVVRSGADDHGHATRRHASIERQKT